MEKKAFNKSLRIILALLILLGCVTIGLGIGFWISKIIPACLISFGIGLLLITLLIIILEYDKY